jgi:hypothetical protein
MSHPGRLHPAEEYEDPHIIRRFSLQGCHFAGKASLEDVDVRKVLDELLSGSFQIGDPEDFSKIVIGDINAANGPGAARPQKIPFDAFSLEVPQSVFPSPLRHH